LGIFGRDDHPPETGRIQPSPNHSPDPVAETANRTVIARPTRIEGKLLGSGEILVDGTVHGEIDSQGRVRIGEHGKIEADVHARTVEVAGTVRGHIIGDERIILEPSATVDGDITAPRILIQDGATFRGQVNMREPEPRPDLKKSSAGKDSSDPTNS